MKFGILRLILPPSRRFCCKADLIVDDEMNAPTSVKMWKIGNQECLSYNALLK